MLKCTPFFFVCFLTVTKKKFFIEFFQIYVCSNQTSFLFGFCEDIKTTLVVAFSCLFPFKSRFFLTSSISKMKVVLLEHFWVKTYLPLILFVFYFFGFRRVFFYYWRCKEFVWRYLTKDFTEQVIYWFASNCLKWK